MKIGKGGKMPKKDWFDEALQMYKPGEFGYKKIAEHFGLSVKTVETRFLRYKRKYGSVFQPPTVSQPGNKLYVRSSIIDTIKKQAYIGGLIITIHVNDDGTINRFLPEFIPFYDEIKNDY